MSRRNFFMSYKHYPDNYYLTQLRVLLKDKTFYDYGFDDLNLEEKSKWEISRKIQYRLWSSSVVIVLIGENTAESDWVDWELWYALRTIKNSSITRRVFKPKGLLALYLPVKKHSIPIRLRHNIDTGYAEEIYWEELKESFDSKVTSAYNNRKNQCLIDNSLKTRIKPQFPINRFIEYTSNPRYNLLNKSTK